MIGMCLNLECQEQDCYFDEQQLKDHQKVNQCRDYQYMNNNISRYLIFKDSIQYFKQIKGSFNNKGVALKQLKKYEEAFICFEKAIQSDPNNPFGHYNKGCSLIKTKNYVDAIICLNNALNLNPTWSSPQYEISFIILG
ncbi:unnamed protein product (macronuclear) [Paramecium tetraurelia]|uniref:Uncharacterized protein n=1 Tax=Paramecium tetraurelia TaxID=5888 RepID=A0C700_PARTE|nr:uncharacterized protein GSPATT00035696001 [Paramecium tetraurelia]CAK66567.1 unnamed protein product [Paramecium tetraurelia]|eukprot:XP_001433964.1 hypothetical protein (macronuclear) [Paramecium tetraurelia strain d4-2]